MSTFTRIVLTLLVVGCGDEAETVEHRCERVRNQLVALEVPLGDPKREQHVHVMRRAMGDQFIAQCAKSMTDKQRDCVLAATDSKAAFACTQKRAQNALRSSK